MHAMHRIHQIVIRRGALIFGRLPGRDKAFARKPYGGAVAAATARQYGFMPWYALYEQLFDGN